MQTPSFFHVRIMVLDPVFIFYAFEKALFFAYLLARIQLGEKFVPGVIFQSNQAVGPLNQTTGNTMTIVFFNQTQSLPPSG